MKKLLVLSLLLFGCETRDATVETTMTKISGTDIYLYVIDNCEYIGKITGFKSDFLAHKGNCKYCTERNKLNK